MVVKNPGTLNPDIAVNFDRTLKKESDCQITKIANS